MSELERWGIHVDGIALPEFGSSNEAEEYKKDHLQGKDAIIFPYQHQEVEVKKSAQEEQEEDYYTPGHA